MSTEQNKTLVRTIMEEVWSKRNVAAIDEIFAPEYVGHLISHPGSSYDIEAAKQSSAAFLSSFPDLRVTLHDLFAGGDRVAVRYTFRATHSGEFSGIAPTGRRVTFSAMAINRCHAGRLWSSDRSWTPRDCWHSSTTSRRWGRARGSIAFPSAMPLGF